MSDNDFIDNGGIDSIHIIKPPEQDDWRCYILGDKITVRPDKGKTPNWFHRWMHYVFFGARWVRDKNE